MAMQVVKNQELVYVNKLLYAYLIKISIFKYKPKSKLVKEFRTSAEHVMNVPEQACIVLAKENDEENIGATGQLLADG